MCAGTGAPVRPVQRPPVCDPRKECCVPCALEGEVEVAGSKLRFFTRIPSSQRTQENLQPPKPAKEGNSEVDTAHKPRNVRARYLCNELANSPNGERHQTRRALPSWRPTQAAVQRPCPDGGMYHSCWSQLLATTPTGSAWTLTTMPDTRKPHRIMCHDCYAVDSKALRELLVPTVKIHRGSSAACERHRSCFPTSISGHRTRCASAGVARQGSFHGSHHRR